ncbi:hypothetical protein [Teredinibacter purpureus]|uniref:hypothetical protein n=1 Tax=Teredinibacter purpureus TaxID=2731756 RepID=UPI0005F77B13|nr:hypothetical protein [Teredinibacter purpureus]
MDTDKASEEFKQLPSLVKELWNDEKSGPLTNQAAREIERLNAALQQAVNERNEAWFQLEELQESRDVTAGVKNGKTIVSG